MNNTSGEFTTVHNLDMDERTSWIGYFDNRIKPVLWIDSGDIVKTQTDPIIGGQLHPGITLKEIREKRDALIESHISTYKLTGPIGVRQAAPGDCIEVRILRLVPESFCYTYNMPGGGLLGEDGIPCALKISPVNTLKNVVHFASGIDIPLKPMLGIVAVAPKEDGRINAIPPDCYGGNLDWSELGPGTSLFLPVFCPGALLCVGDAHAAQGCGEVGGNALEVGMKHVEFQVILHKGKKLAQPYGETPTHWVTFGLDKDITTAAKKALREAVRFLCEEKGLSSTEAYLLCSSTVDLCITQCVNIISGVHARIPKNIFNTAEG